MRFIIHFGIGVFNFIYFFFKLLPTKQKIVYISRQMDTAPVDFQLLKEEMEKKYPQYENVILAKMIHPGILSKIKYLFHMFCQMYHIATAKIVVLDTYCIMVSVLTHKKDLVVVQMWHAMGAFKKFGYSILDKEEGSSSKLASLMKMHNNYSHVFASSEFCRPYFAEAFHQPIEKVKVFPLPKADLILSDAYRSKKCAEICKEYPQLKKGDKKIIVYAPTFRKNTNGMEKTLRSLIKAIDFSQYELIIKLHPIVTDRFYDSRVIIDKSFSSFDMFSIADYIITDYSAVIFEAMLLHKPLFLYAFDYESYHNKRDFYFDYKKQFQGIIYETAEQIMTQIRSEQYNTTILQNLSEKMIRKTDSTYTSEICEFLISTVQKKHKRDR